MQKRILVCLVAAVGWIAGSAWGQPGVKGFLDLHGGEWEVHWDPQGDHPERIEGSGVPMMIDADHGVESADNALDLGEMVQRLKGFMAQHPDLWPVASRDLHLDRRRSRARPEEGLYLIRLRQTHQKLPVLGAHAYFRVVAGNLVQFGGVRLAPVTTPARPTLGASEALWRALEPLGIEPTEHSSERARLAFTPAETGATETGHHLVWQLTYSTQGGGSREALVDAHTGALVSHRSLVHESSGATFTVRGGAYQGLPFDFVHETVFPFLEVEDGMGTSYLTDREGAVTFPLCESTMGCEPRIPGLVGAFVEVDDHCGPSDWALDEANTAVSLGGSDHCGTDCEVPGTGGGLGNTHAARTVYLWGTQTLDLLSQEAFTLGQISADTNDATDSCQARWDGGTDTMTFYQSDAGCRNTGELPGMVVHEIGHALADHLGGFGDAASEEAVADVLAFIMTEDACIARGLVQDKSCEGCRGTCDGLRDLAAFPVGHPQVAHWGTVKEGAGLNCGQYACPYTVNGVPKHGPLGFEAHCESLIASTAMVDLAEGLKGKYGDVAGWQRFKDLWFDAVGSLGSAYKSHGPLCVPTGTDGCGPDNWYTVLRTVLDGTAFGGDGDLSNGAPDDCVLWQALAPHGMACGSPCHVSADAGPDRRICVGESVALGVGPSNYPLGTQFLWQATGDSTARTTVAPEHTNSYTLEVTSPGGMTDTDGVTVAVAECLETLDEDFDGMVSGWQGTGLWHRECTTDSSCALLVPPFPSGNCALYFGIPDICDYDTCELVSGDLLSPPIVVNRAGMAFEFQSFRGVEQSEPEQKRVGMDRAEVWVVPWGGGATKELRWARDSHDDGGSWVASGAISLDRYFDPETPMKIQLLFRFDSVDEIDNVYSGWWVDDVRVFDVEPGDTTNHSPTLSIVEPALPSSLAPPLNLPYCSCNTLVASAADVEDQDAFLENIVLWESSEDGVLGTGGGICTMLSPGTHAMTASVIDRGGEEVSEEFTVHIPQGASPCPELESGTAKIKRLCGRGDT